MFPKMLVRLASPDQPQHGAICFTYWLQWHLSRQLKAASAFARLHQIALKGDLPIGASSIITCCIRHLQGLINLAVPVAHGIHAFAEELQHSRATSCKWQALAMSMPIYVALQHPSLSVTDWKVPEMALDGSFGPCLQAWTRGAWTRGWTLASSTCSTRWGPLLTCLTQGARTGASPPTTGRRWPRTATPGGAPASQRSPSEL